MPRANRHFLPNQFWHLTHRCHEKALLLKFARKPKGAYALDFGRESESLTLDNTVLWQKKEEAIKT